MDQENLDAIVNAIIKELTALGIQPAPLAPADQTRTLPISESRPVETQPDSDLIIDLNDPTTQAVRRQPGVHQPIDPESLSALMDTTTARIGAGRAGVRLRTASLLLFQSDLAVTQDALYRDVDANILAEFNLFQVQTQVTGGKQEYLLRPDLGRRLSTEARHIITERCVKSPNIQVCVGDGLSAAAIDANLRKIMPVIQSGCQTAKLSLGTPFFIQYCRVGVMNDIGDLLKPDVLILLIGERPGLGRAESMSAYMAYRPASGQNDADREVICNIFDGGGTNPLEAGAYALQLAQKMIKKQSSGVKSRLIET
jgi:ethanolamine ammonia-lyase small subunit